jgi:hypothetical protein
MTTDHLTIESHEKPPFASASGGFFWSKNAKNEKAQQDNMKKTKKPVYELKKTF